MYKYEVVAVDVNFKDISSATKKISNEAKKRPNSRLVAQTSVAGGGGFTELVLLTFETKVAD
ncbi:MAG: hypothetical protein COA91_05530 [Robiginitomaculum sp.]|nr:MAG: hypothetical protein COA91_05530 [Robiginitomaculum sp.]